MLKFSGPFQIGFRSLVALSLASAMTGCDQNAAELAALKSDNERLRVEIANLRRKASGEKAPDAPVGKADLILGISELWSQRFEDNEFRARKRLADKTLRVTGILEGISRENLRISGMGKSRNVQVSVNLDKNYAERIQGGLAALEQGITITVQGKFIYDRMEMSEATIVDKDSGETLSAEQLEAFGQVVMDGLPVANPPPENQ